MDRESQDQDETKPVARAPVARRRRRPAGWALGLPVLALLAAVAAMRISPAVEINIRREAAKLARGESPLVQAGARVMVAGRDVRIVTDVELPEDARAEAERRALAIPAVRKADSEATGYVALSPFPFSVKRSDAGIELSGGVPSAALRERLVAEAGRFVPADQVEDRLRLASGEPEGFARMASHLIASLGPLDAFDATLSDRRLRVSARPRDTVSYNTAMAAMKALPRGFGIAELDLLPPRIEPFVWTARRDDGGLALGGAVPSEAKRGELIRLAREVLPDLPVRDAMQTARGLDRSVDFLAVARAAFEALGRLRTGEAQIAERRFALSGETVAKDGPATVERRLRETLPGALGSPIVSLEVVPASPFLFTARRVDGRIELSGYVPAERDRTAAAALATGRYPGERLVDRLVVADGAPAGFADAMRVALETLSDFSEGTAMIRGSELSYDGRVLYGQLAARIRRTAPTQIPEGWRARVELDPVPPPGALDSHLCADLLSDMARRNPVRFEPGKAAPAPNAGPALEAAADVARRCGRVRIRIVHHLGTPADPEAGRDLAADRARALATALAERGATARFSVEGATAPGTGEERNEFRITPL